MKVINFQSPGHRLKKRKENEEDKLKNILSLILFPILALINSVHHRTNSVSP